MSLIFCVLPFSSVDEYSIKKYNSILSERSQMYRMYRSAEMYSSQKNPNSKTADKQGKIRR